MCSFIVRFVGFQGPTTPLNSNANAQRGFVQLLFIFIHLLIVPFLPDTLAIVCPIILALCFGLFGNDGEVCLTIILLN